MRTRRKIAICLIPLYLVTWIGGYYSHSAILKRDTQRLYDAAKQRDTEFAADAAKGGFEAPRPMTRTDSPVSKVEWCFPVFPGVLIADSYYVIGPLYGRGGVKIVFYYGFGSWATKPIWGWIS
jgi:hypothetical protein